jgi:hypothetical protein
MNREEPKAQYRVLLRHSRDGEYLVAKVSALSKKEAEKMVLDRVGRENYTVSRSQLA